MVFVSQYVDYCSGLVLHWLLYVYYWECKQMWIWIVIQIESYTPLVLCSNDIMRNKCVIVHVKLWLGLYEEFCHIFQRLQLNVCPLVGVHTELSRETFGKIDILMSVLLIKNKNEWIYVGNVWRYVTYHMKQWLNPAIYWWVI